MRLSAYGGHRGAHGDARRLLKQLIDEGRRHAGPHTDIQLVGQGLPDNLYHALLDRLADWPLELPAPDGQPVLIVWAIPIAQECWPSPRRPGLPTLIGDPYTIRVLGDASFAQAFDYGLTKWLACHKQHGPYRFARPHLETWSSTGRNVHTEYWHQLNYHQPCPTG